MLHLDLILYWTRWKIWCDSARPVQTTASCLCHGHNSFFPQKTGGAIITLVICLGQKLCWWFVIEADTTQCGYQCGLCLDTGFLSKQNHLVHFLLLS